MFAEFLLQKQEKYQIKYDFLDECEIFYSFFSVFNFEAQHLCRIDDGF